MDNKILTSIDEPNHEPFIIEGSAIIYLETDKFSRLREQNYLDWEYKCIFKKRDGREWVRPPPDRNKVLLAVEESQFFFYEERTPNENFDSLLDLSFFVNYDSTTHQLHLLSNNPLRKDIFSRKMYSNNAPSRKLLPVGGKQDEYKNFFTESAIEAHKESGRCVGLLSICSCQNPDCKSTFAWIEDNIGLLLVEINSGGIRKVEIGPFPIVKP